MRRLNVFVAAMAAADSRKASISGLGDIRVKAVTGRVSKSVTGGGPVSIGERPS